MPEKILVVDDDIDTLRLVGLMLQRQGYQIAAANSGQQALAMADSEKPDLILLDVMMPDMDGYEVTRRLRANPAISTIPIIMFTAKSQVDDKVSGFESGADDYLTKPTQPRELFAHIKAVLSRGTKARPAPTATTAVAGNRGRVIGVLAVKGGMGVSTLAVNVAISLRLRTKKEVILAEFRPGEGSLSLDLGYLKPEGMSRLLERKPKEITAAETEAELMTHSSGVRMLLASFQPSDARYTTAVDHFNTMTQCMAYQADYIVLDLGPGIPPITNKVLNSCDELVVLLESNPYTIMRTKVLVDELTQRGFGEGRIIVVLYNRVRSEFQIPVAQVQEQFKHGIAIVFTPAPELIFQASKNNIPLVIQHPDNLTSQQFAKLADNIAKHVRQKT
jgi:pilus assembly protein CpaE